MSSIKELKVNGKIITFVNRWESRRNGFSHESEVFFEGHFIAKNRVNYTNRTWERYTYQTTMRGAIYDLMERQKQALKDLYKRENNLARLTAKHSEKLNEKIYNDSYMQFLKSIYEQL